MATNHTGLLLSRNSTCFHASGHKLVITKSSFSYYVVQSYNSCALKDTFSSILTRLPGTLQGKSSAFSTALCEEATKTTVSCSRNTEKSLLRSKPQAILMFIFFLKEGGIEDTDRQPRTSRVFMSPLNPRHLSQSERGFRTKQQRSAGF